MDEFRGLTWSSAACPLDIRATTLLAARPLERRVRPLWWQTRIGMNIKEMVDEIRNVVGRCDRSIPEVDVMEALVNESEGWSMRLQELENAEGDDG